MADNTITGTLSVTGNLGIGAEPLANAPLYVRSSTDQSQVLIENSAGTLLKLAVNASDVSIGTDMGTTLPLSFQTNGTSRISIDSIGSVNMTGSLTVQNNLNVAGNISIGGLTIQTISSGTPPTNTLQVNGRVKATAFEGNGATLDGVVKKVGDTITGPLTVQNNLTVTGNVGIGTTEPQGKLDVRGAIHAGNSDIYFTKTDHNHTGIGNTIGFAAIENVASYGALMILGRSTPPSGRRIVKLWDYLQVNGDLDVTGNINGKLTGIGIAITNALVDGSSIPIPSGFTKEECIFFAYIKAIFNTSAIPYNCIVQNGVIRIVRQGLVDSSATPINDLTIFATGIAIAKRGGW
ncbi:MAG TPA: hypothetical protein V6C85_29965 [Allocoleopsis sp.]